MSTTYSLFKTNQDANEVNYITIDFGGTLVKGFLTKPIGLDVDASYATFFNIDSRLGLIGELAGLAGFNIGKSGYWTRQYYNGGSYIKLDGEMRIVNWDEDKDVVLDAMETLISRCMPAHSGVVTATEDKIAEMLSSSPSTSGTASTSTTKVIKDKVMKFAGGLIANLVSNAPQKANITTNYIKLENMLLKSVNCIPSKEILASGKPLYADITFSFMQDEIKTQGQIQSMIGVNHPRVEVK